MALPVRITIRRQGPQSGIQAVHSMATIRRRRSPRVRQGSLPRLEFVRRWDRAPRSTLPVAAPDLMACHRDRRLRPVVARGQARNHSCPPQIRPASGAASRCARRQYRQRSCLDRNRFACRHRHCFESFSVLPSPARGGNHCLIVRSVRRPSSWLWRCTHRSRSTKCREPKSFFHSAPSSFRSRS